MNVVDPLAGSPWSRPEMVAAFSSSVPNSTLMQFAEQELVRVGPGRAVDLGCGAGRNAIPLAVQGWNVLGVDLSVPMLRAAAARVHEHRLERNVQLALAPMDRLPVGDRSCDLVIAHGIWNLARSAAEFRRAVREAARVATAGLISRLSRASRLSSPTSPVSRNAS
jgi:ubiquinone/menaquinone biosynthesis C-methylase UbiE